MDDSVDRGENESVELASPSHPGDILREWIDGHGETVTGTARRLGVSRTTLSRVLAGEGRLNAEMAVTLEEMGWSTARLWTALQSGWEVARVRRARREAA